MVGRMRPSRELQTTPLTRPKSSGPWTVCCLQSFEFNASSYVALTSKSALGFADLLSALRDVDRGVASINNQWCVLHNQVVVVRRVIGCNERTV